MDDQIAVVHRPRRARSSYRLSRTEIWANGVAKSSMYAFTPTDIDHVVGAKLQPFHDLNFRVGTQLIRGAGEASQLSATTIWEAFWSQDLRRWGGLSVGLFTTGSMDNRQTAYSQSVMGTLGIPLNLPVDRWRTELRLSPSMNLDASNGTFGSGLLSEIVGQTVIGARDDAFRSVLNVKVGYSFAPDTQPVASARLELRISPNL